MRKILFITAFILILGPVLAAQDDYFKYSEYNDLTTDICVGVGAWVKDYGIRNVWGDEEQYVYFLDYRGRIHKYKVWLTNEGSAADPTPHIDPHQHPDNPDATGPIEPRHFEFVSSHFVAGDVGYYSISRHSNEIHVDASGVYIGATPLGIHRWNHDWTYVGKIAEMPPVDYPDPLPDRTETLAYNPDDNIIYVGGRYRDIWELRDTDNDGDFLDETWQLIFTYDALSDPPDPREHHDGMEYAGGFLWVSDMFSDKIAKWGFDGASWTEIATYTYTEFAYVEGMGFGPNDHFWIGGGWQIDPDPTDYSYFYEIGGGKLIVEIPVYVDIKPGSCPNPLNTKSTGVLPVAILGTEDFDVIDIDPVTIQLEGVAPLRWAYEDVATPFDGELCECHDLDGDGYLDLTLKFDTQEVVAALGIVNDGDVIELAITGILKEEEGGTPISGQDCVVILLK